MAASPYVLLDGTRIALDRLRRRDLEFLVDLQRRALGGEDYFRLERAVCGAGAYPLAGSARVTLAVHRTPLFRVAEDVAFRAGIHQGVLAAGEDEAPVPTDAIVGVAEAARRLAISRAAVVKAVRAGRLRGKKVGRSWVIVEDSVSEYRVAPHRVAAGRAARHAKRRSRRRAS